jgi:hypothetical protein
MRVYIHLHERMQDCVSAGRGDLVLAHLALRPEAPTRLRELAATKGITTDKALAEAMEINESQYHRVLSRTCKPGAKFIAGALLVVGDQWFTALFETFPEGQAA